MEPDGSSRAIMASQLNVSLADRPGLSIEKLNTSLSPISLGNRPTLVSHSSSQKQMTSLFNQFGIEDPPCRDHKDPDTSLTLNSFDSHHGLKVHSASENGASSTNHVGMEAPRLHHNGLDTSHALNSLGNRPRLAIGSVCKKRPRSVNGAAQSTRPPSPGNERMENRRTAFAMLSIDSEKTGSERKKELSIALRRDEIEEDFLFITGQEIKLGFRVL